MTNPLWDNPERLQGTVLPTYANRFDLGALEYPFRNVYSAGGVTTLLETGITAAGTTIADAYDLTKALSVVTTTAAGTGVQLDDAKVGAQREVKNLGANALLVYPEAAGTVINALAAGAGFSIAAGGSATFRRVSAALWVTV